MHGTSWTAIALGLLLLISASSERGHAAQPPPQRGRILGIGGVFFRSANRDQTRDWYAKHLGIADKGQGAVFQWREQDDPKNEHKTSWTVFSKTANYFDPGQPFMIDYIVDDMDVLLDRLKQEGVKIDDKRMNESFGKFAWIYDPDGNKVELWQPIAAKTQ